MELLQHDLPVLKLETSFHASHTVQSYNSSSFTLNIELIYVGE